MTKDGSQSDDDSGVDQEGLEMLLNALGEDGLDDFDRAQIVALGGEHSDDESGDEDNVSDNTSESGEEENYMDDNEEDGEDVALDEIESIDDDVIPQQKIVVDNKVALGRIRESIKLDPSLPWTETLTMTYPEKIEVDVNDDLQRELAFYKQALHGANTARALAAKHNFPFTRPSDFFAEMVKSDVHMERIRQRLLDENASIKRSEEKRKEREGKKFGKQVQLEKLKARQASKKQMEERIKGLKRKCKDVLDRSDDEGFDVKVEDAIADRPAKRAKGDVRPKLSRKARNNKYGFGGPKKHSKQNTRDSTDNFGPGTVRGKSGKGGKGGKSKRPGKSKRIAMRGKR